MSNVVCIFSGYLFGYVILRVHINFIIINIIGICVIGHIAGSVIGVSIFFGDRNVSACTELFLWTTTYHTSTILTNSPVVASHITPLHHTLGACKATRQSVLGVEFFGTWSWIVPCARAINPLQYILVQTFIGNGDMGLVVRTEAELEETHVVGCELHSQLDDATVLVLPDDDSQAVFSSTFVVTWLFCIPGVSARSTLPFIPLPLAGVASAIDLVVIVVWGRFEAISPS